MNNYSLTYAWLKLQKTSPLLTRLKAPTPSLTPPSKWPWLSPWVYPEDWRTVWSSLWGEDKGSRLRGFYNVMRKMEKVKKVFLETQAWWDEWILTCMSGSCSSLWFLPWWNWSCSHPEQRGSKRAGEVREGKETENEFKLTGSGRFRGWLSG